MADPSLVRFRAVVQRSLAELEARRDEVNDLNVFPVADGDTGDNMALTLRAVLDELDRLSEKGELDEIDRDEIVEGVARAALLGARGNSGVILSQLIRGAAEELASRPGELVDPVLIGAAMARAADRAYDSVREPAEGTILTVVREMAHRVAFELPHMDQPRLSQDEVDRQDLLIAEVLERALDAGQQSVRRGPDLLPVLREAGVVDAGGFGLTVIFAGVIAALRGAEAPELDHHAPARVTHPQHESSTYRYCTNFAVTGEDLDPNAWIARLEAIGDSVLVVGDPRTLKVHVHTDHPGHATGAVRRRRRRLAARRRRHARAGPAAHGAPERADRGVRRRGGRGRQGDGGAVHLARRHAAAGRPDAEPVDLRAAGRHPRRARRGGRRAAELAERPDGGRARRRAVGQEGRRGADALPAGGARGRGRARLRPQRTRATGRRC